MNRRVALFCFLFLPMVTSAQKAPEPDSLPSWVLFGLGQQAYEQKRFGEAAVYFRRAVDRRGIYPEAEAALAKIASQGEGSALQQAQLQKALDERGLLQVPDDKYALLYSLADLQLRGDPGLSVEKGEAALETWREILNDDQPYQAVEASGGLEGYYNALMVRNTPVNLKTATGPSLTQNLIGLNRLLYLYRHPLTFSLKAHQEIASLSVVNKAYKQAIAHSLFALVGIFSTVIEQVRVYHPEYSFRGLDDLFTDRTSSVYIGKPDKLESSASADSPNPGWLVRYQPIWDYLRASGAQRSLDTILAALDGLAAQKLSSPDQRPFKEVTAEIRRWKAVLFPETGAAVRG